MSYEINLIAVNQQRPIHLNSVKRVLLHNEIEHDEVNRYAEIWPFFSNTKGILYSLVEEVNEEYYDLIELQTKRNNGKMKGGQKNCKSDWFEKRYYGFASCS